MPVGEDKGKELVRLEEDVPDNDQAGDKEVEIKAMDKDVVGSVAAKLVARITMYTARSGARVSLIERKRSQRGTQAQPRSPGMPCRGLRHWRGAP